TDRVYDDYPAVTYTGVRLTLDTGQIFNAASADASWASWSSNAVVFPAAGSHTATATASTREGTVASAGPITVQEAPLGPTLTLVSPLTTPSLDYGLRVRAQ